MQEDMNKPEDLITADPEKWLEKQVGNYRIIRWLGRGACADVYLGEHIYLKTQSAIKMLYVHLPKKAQKDFLNEVGTVARLDHPNIVRLFDYGVENGTPFLVMVYAPNGSLRQRLPKGTRVPLEQIIPLVQQIASALDYAHQEKVLHGDLKPENILLGAQDQVLLSDFGLVLLAQGMQAANTMVDAALYKAPEMLEGKVDFASDQYALGILTYEWLCGEYPFTGSINQIETQQVLSPPPSLRESVPDLPSAIEQVIFKALAKDQTQRYENVTAFANALQSAWENTPSTSAKSLTLQPLSSPSSEKLLASEETSALPGPIRPMSSFHDRRTNWQIVLLLVAIVAVIASGTRLWYIIASSSILAHSTAPAIGKDNPTSLANVSTPVMTTPISATSGGTPSVSLPAPVPTPLASYEAESLLNTLADGATVLKCPRCSGGEKVGYIGLDYNTKTNGTLQFNNIYKNSGGKYELTIYYLLSGIDVPTGYMSVNGDRAAGFIVPSTANGKVVGTLTIMVSLNAGNNTIEFSNPSALAPDIDRIVV